MDKDKSQPDKTYVLKAARLFDGKSGALVTPGVVVVTGGKIVGRGSKRGDSGRRRSDRIG